jgi:TPR repeat protein
MGIAYLSGQLGLQIQPALGLDYLRRSADMATVDSPQAAFFYGTLLAGENQDVPFPSELLLPPNSPPSPLLEAQHRDAKSYILKAAYLCFSAALYKAGVMHEYAQLTCPYDPLLSVQYYALASQEGEIEADMALSKWFLVGAEGCFEKEEKLSRTFADKAAQKGLPTGLFALGYYNE